MQALFQSCTLEVGRRTGTAPRTRIGIVSTPRWRVRSPSPLAAPVKSVAWVPYLRIGLAACPRIASSTRDMSRKHNLFEVLGRSEDFAKFS